MFRPKTGHLLIGVNTDFCMSVLAIDLLPEKITQQIIILDCGMWHVARG